MLISRNYSASDLNKVKELVSRLLENPAIKNEPPVIGERLIGKFIENNSEEFGAELKSTGIMPDIGRKDLFALISEDIYNRVASSTLPPIISFINNTDLSFFDRISETGVVADVHRRRKLHDYTMLLFRDREVRFRMYPVIAAFKNNAVDRYIGEIFKRREYIYNSITGSDVIIPETETYIRMIKVIMLLRNIVYYNSDNTFKEYPGSVSVSDFSGDSESFKAYIEQKIKPASSMLPGIPASILRLAVKSHLPSGGTASGDSLSRLIYILCSMFRFYREIKNPGRGSEPEEKSWLGIAKHNSAYFSYDIAMIESLYCIAEDNNW